MQLLREYIQVLLLEAQVSSKAIFMAGAPGSGKSSVIGSLGLSDSFEIINPDDEYEDSKTKYNLPFDRSPIEAEYELLKKVYKEAVAQDDQESISSIEPEYLRLRGILSADQKAFATAISSANARKKELIDNKANYLVDGTGGSYKPIEKQVIGLRAAGYDVAMIYIDIDLDTSIARDISRGKSGGRRLGAKTVERSHGNVAKNKEKYQELFGQNFIYINTSSDITEEEVQNAKQQIFGFMQS